MYTSFEDLPISLTVKDIKRIFGIGQAQAYKLVDSPGFPSMRVGTRICIIKPLLIEWLREQTQAGAGEQI
ncbi:MAG: helix-turn-helix domain-containing protein [Hydrogenoanaerobacterium sp.]